MKEVIITSSILIICITLLRRLCRGKISALLQYALWLIVAVRLIWPAVDIIFPDLLPESEISIMNVAERIEISAQDYILPSEEIIGQVNVPAGGLPIVAVSENEDGPTAIFYAGKIGFTWIDLFRGIWYAGMVIAGVWMVAVNVLFMRRLHAERIKYEEEDYALPVYTVKDISSPCLYGILGKKAVYIPEEVSDDEEKVNHILAHEYCHYKHKDVFWAGLRCILVVIYWFNPLVWLAAILSKQDCELACDEAAIRLLGEEERIAYGKTLLSLIAAKTKVSDIMCTATTMNAGKKSIKERVKRIAEKPHRLAVVLLPVFAIIGAVIAFTFTQAKEYPDGAYLLEDGSIITTDCFQIIFPESLASNIYCLTENDTDVIIYHKKYKKEVGRFCSLTYEEAVKAADENEIVLIGDYGQNPRLKAYMNGEEYEDEFVTEHHYYTETGNADGQDAAGTENAGSQGIAGTENADGQGISSTENAGSQGVPGTDINDETTYIIDDENSSSTQTASGLISQEDTRIPAPEDVDSEIINLPYDENEEYNAQSVESMDEGQEGQPSESIKGTQNTAQEAETHDYKPNEAALPAENVELPAEYIELPDEHVETIVLPEESVFMPSERVITSAIPRMELCYIYVSADNSDIGENAREEIEKVNSELVELSESLMVLSISADSMEDILGRLIEERNPDADNYTSAYSKIAQALPEPLGLHYNMLQIDTGTKPFSVTVHYRLLSDNIEAIDRNTLFINAALIFSLDEELEVCSFQINEDVNKIKEPGFAPEDFQTETIVYERSEMEEIFGKLYSQSETKEAFMKLYNSAIEHLKDEKYNKYISLFKKN